MLLNRYFGSHVFETLKEAKLKTSRISSFNDPFEFLFVASGKTTAEKARKFALSQMDSPEFVAEALSKVPGFNRKMAMRKLPLIVANIVKNSKLFDEPNLKEREELTDRFMRVVCFSAANVKPLDEILMWSHYTAKHFGVRIGFEFPDGIKDPFMVYQMIYEDKRVSVDFSLGSQKDALFKESMFKSVTTKSSAWRYENEYRLITLPEKCEVRKMPDSTIEHFVNFEPEWVKSIDFGVRCPDIEIHRIVDLLKTDYAHVICRKAEFHKTEYALDYVKI